MLHFIVDGYNLINKIEKLNKLSLKGKRDAFLSLLADYKARISLRNKITVVFDGKREVFHPAVKNSYLDVIFSKGQDADSLIRTMIDEKVNSKSLVIVTDDNEILYYAKSRRIRHKSAKGFLEQINRKRNTSRQDEDFKIDFKQAYKINEELRKVWMKKN